MRYNVYYGANQWRKTNLSREDAIKHYHRIKSEADKAEENVYIYSPTHDFYVSDHFLDRFLGSSYFGKLMFEDGATLLSKEEGEDTYKWNLNGKILISTPTGITHIKTIKQSA